MDRRSFLAAAGGTAAAALTLGRTGLADAAGPAGPRPAASGLVWAANFTSATNSSQARFGNVQTQRGDGSIQNNGSPIQVVDHDTLGRCLRLHLNANDERLEAAPGGGGNLGEGASYYFRVDFALGSDFPLNQSNYFCLINQIHQASNSGSPPVEFDVHDGALWVRGASTAYNKRLVGLTAVTKYSLVYHAVLSSSASNGKLDVWVNGTKVLDNYTPACPLRVGGNSYWKGATMYCDPEIPPLTVYQNAHRVGTTYESVTA